MNIIGIGVDIESIKRFKKNIKNKKFIDLIFTKREIEYCESKKNSAESYAARFSAKEAVVKAFGELDKKISFADIEVVNKINGAPTIKLKGNKFKNYKIHISLAHSSDQVTAFVIINKWKK